MRLRRGILCLARFAAFLVLAATFAFESAYGQAQPLPGPGVPEIYQRLLAQIEKIPVFDNHGHPGLPNDPDVDAMQIPADGPAPFRLRDDNDEMLGAARKLFEYPYSDFSPEHLKWLANRKTEERKKLGNAYFSHILDQLGIETAIANRVSMPAYLDPARFRWVYFVDYFLFPFDAQRLEGRNPDQKLNVPLERKLLAGATSQKNAGQMPSDLRAYLKFITGIVEEKQSAGCVGIKFEIAYFRSLHFDDPAEEHAAAIYAKYRAGGVPDDADYRDFQDFVFRYLLREAGRLHLPVQIHTAVGGGDYFNMRDGNIMGLENVLRDPRYENVPFDLLHGGFPYDREAIWLAARKNVYLDSSLMGIFVYPDELHRILRLWLETFPDKIVFGSDTFPFSDAIGAEEGYWLAVQSARTALAAALAEMVAEHEIGEKKAVEMARAYLHDTAARLYGKPN
jgi:predicted TIM-barrel fold metal-dependent hydrolase